MRTINLKLVNFGILVAILVMVVCEVCVVLFTVNQWRNSNRITNAQIEVYKAQAENVGKPQIIEQRYFSPQKEK